MQPSSDTSDPSQSLSQTTSLGKSTIPPSSQSEPLSPTSSPTETSEDAGDVLTTLIEDVGPLVHNMTPEELMQYIQNMESKRKNASEMRKVTAPKEKAPSKAKKPSDKNAVAQAQEFLDLLLGNS